MQNALERILKELFQHAACERTVCVASGNKERIFLLYHRGDDYFLIQRDLFGERSERRRSVMLLKRSDLKIGRKGWLFIAANGAFSSILMPLLSGRMEGLSRVKRSDRSEVLAHRTVLGAVTREGVDLLQRDTQFDYIVAADAWLQALGLGLNEISFPDKTPQLMTYVTQLGQEWRVRPAVYTYEEMLDTVLRAWQYLETSMHYCVSVKGVHYITYPEFMRIVALSRRDEAAVRDCLREWVALPSGQTICNLRRLKYGSLHTIEFFGVRRSDAERYLIPSLERLLEGVTIGRMGLQDVHDTLSGIALLYHCLLVNPAYTSIRHKVTVKALYTLITGRTSHSVDAGETLDLAFDARRIALPGATFVEGEPHYHPGVDERSRSVIEHLLERLSVYEVAEYINVYEVRSSKTLTAGQIREIVLKTNLEPLPISFIEKRMNSVRVGYASYLLTRTNIFRALGIAYPDRVLLSVGKQKPIAKRETPFFLRSRCPGDPLHSIPKTHFLVDPFCPMSAEDVDVVLRLAHLYGATAAQNMIVKKFLIAERSCRFGVGKEIFEFAYDPAKKKLMPYRVTVCSIRGSLGWPNTEHSRENLEDTYRFYLRVYADTLGNYWREHAEACTLAETATAFFDGFEGALAEVRWNYLNNKERFDAFNPPLREIFAFREKFSFALWALEQMSKDIVALRERFMDYVRDAFVKVR